MVANRLCEPTSKLGVCERWLKKVYLPSCAVIKRPQFYEAMDLLNAHADELERVVFGQIRHLFNLEVDVVFYDTTTATFSIDYEDESKDEHDNAGGIRKRGRNKGGGWRPQVVVALAVTKEGFPVRSWVFPGNTTDVKTVQKVKQDLGHWKLGRCLFVADAGMNSEDNRAALAEASGRYLLATRAASVSEIKKEVLGRPGRFKTLEDNLKVKEIQVGSTAQGKRYFLCYNEKEARRQEKQRNDVLGQLREEMAKHKKNVATAKWAIELRSSKRTGKYLSVTKSGKLRVDMKKVRAAERLDGKWVLQSNDPDLTAEDAARGYKAEQIIERCFAKMKGPLIRLAPVHHRLSRRIEAHAKICVLALFLQRFIEQTCGRSWAQIRHDLWQLQATEFRTKTYRFTRRNKVPISVSAILKKLELSTPKAVLGVENEL